MKKLKSKAGFSLIELMCTLLIMVFITMGIGVSMNSGTRIYRDAIFESESATLAGILNTSLGDILRYSIDIREVTPKDIQEHGSEIGIPGLNDSTKHYVFTSLDYGIQDAYFYIPPHLSGDNMGPVQMKNLRNPNVVELVNTGAYPNLVVSDFVIFFSPRIAPGIEGGYFEISYKISSTTDPSKTRDVQTIVRVMND